MSTTNVPLSRDYLYRDIDKLIAFGYVKPTIVGQRPWARSEFARLVGQAISHRDESGEPVPGRIAYIIDELVDEFHEELVEMELIPGEKHTIRLHPLDRLHVGVVGMRSPPTILPVSNGWGTINAVVNPLGDYREGRYAIDGAQLSVETVSRFGLSKYFSIYLRPRFEGSVTRVGHEWSGSALLQNGYGVFEVKNFALELGRDSVVWGVGQRGGNMLTTNPRPFDMVKMTNPHPTTLPWLFKFLGDIRYTVFGANMGPENSHKYAWLVGWKVNMMPTEWLELGIGHLTMIGGEGAPSLTWWEVLGEITFYRPSVAKEQQANQMYELEMLIHLPQLRWTQLYGTLTFEDQTGTSFDRVVRYGTSYQAGIYIPAVGPEGECDMRVEYTHTCPHCFRHSLYSDGHTLNKKLMGTDLGPDAMGVHSEINYDVSNAVRMDFTFDWDHRNSRIWDGMSGVIENRPNEDRYRFVAGGRWEANSLLTLQGALGYERVHNYQFVQGDSRNNFMASILLSLDLDRYTRYSTH